MVLDEYEQKTLLSLEALRFSDDYARALEQREDRCQIISTVITAHVCATMPKELTAAQSAQELSDWHRYVREQCSLKNAGEQGLAIPLDELNAFRLGLRGAMRYFYGLSSKHSVKSVEQAVHAINRHAIEVDW